MIFPRNTIFKTALISVFAFSSIVFSQERIELETFEGYLDSTALVSTWKSGGGGAAIALEENLVFEGTKALKWDYDLSDGADESIYFSIFSNQDWASYKYLVLSVRGRGKSNSFETMMLQVMDSSWKTIGELEYSAGQTQVEGWKEWKIDLSAWGATGLSAVSHFKLYLKSTAGGSGSIYVDDIHLNTGISETSREAESFADGEKNKVSMKPPPPLAR